MRAIAHKMLSSWALSITHHMVAERRQGLVLRPTNDVSVSGLLQAPCFYSLEMPDSDEEIELVGSRSDLSGASGMSGPAGGDGNDSDGGAVDQRPSTSPAAERAADGSAQDLADMWGDRQGAECREEINEAGEAADDSPSAAAAAPHDGAEAPAGAPADASSVPQSLLQNGDHAAAESVGAACSPAGEVGSDPDLTLAGATGSTCAAGDKHLSAAASQPSAVTS